MSKRPCVSMGVSCWYLLVFLGPQSMNKNRSCFLCLIYRPPKKDQKGLCVYRKKAVLLHRQTEKAQNP